MIRDLAQFALALTSVVIIGDHYGLDVPEVPYLGFIWWTALATVLFVEKK